MYSTILAVGVVDGGFSGGSKDGWCCGLSWCSLALVRSLSQACTSPVRLVIEPYSTLLHKLNKTMLKTIIIPALHKCMNYDTTTSFDKHVMDLLFTLEFHASHWVSVNLYMARRGTENGVLL